MGESCPLSIVNDLVSSRSITWAVTYWYIRSMILPYLKSTLYSGRSISNLDWLIESNAISQSKIKDNCFLYSVNFLLHSVTRSKIRLLPWLVDVQSRGYSICNYSNGEFIEMKTQRYWEMVCSTLSLPYKLGMYHPYIIKQIENLMKQTTMCNTRYCYSSISWCFMVNVFSTSSMVTFGKSSDPSFCTFEILFQVEFL